MLTCSPSATPCGLALGPTTPGRIILPQEPLGLRCARFPRAFYATHTDIRTRARSTRAPARASPRRTTLPYHRPQRGRSPPSPVGLSPRTFPPPDHWTSQL